MNLHPGDADTEHFTFQSEVGSTLCQPRLQRVDILKHLTNEEKAASRCQVAREMCPVSGLAEAFGMIEGYLDISISLAEDPAFWRLMEADAPPTNFLHFVLDTSIQHVRYQNKNASCMPRGRPVDC